MKIVSTIEEARGLSRRLRSDGRRLGLVPTMGALHEGHFSLIRAAKANNDAVAVSIFVNPTQFGPNEDFSRYPRDMDHDRQLLEKEDVEFVFAPSVEEMYPAGAVTWVVVEGLSERLCGKSRPGHFRGVATVVAKLFNILEPASAFFGQKDAAQVAIIRRMVRDLNVPVEIAACPIVREPDGLAMSSRNAYLNDSERKSALALNRALRECARAHGMGETDASHLAAAAKQLIAREPGVRLDYFEIVDPDSLQPLSKVEQRALAAVAAFVGSTRLIDNVVLEP